MSKRLLRLKDVMAMTGKSRSAIYADPQFPKPIKIGSRTSAWLLEEIEKWIDVQIAARSLKHAIN